MALLITHRETSAMPKRGPYKKTRHKPPLPQWKRLFLAEWRDLRDMTQEQLSEAAGVSVGLISSLEGGTSGYSADSLHKLAEALSIQPGMLLSVDPTGDEELWSIVLRADPKQRAQIARHASVIVPAKAVAKRK